MTDALFKLIDNIQTTGGVAGLIAIGITLTLCIVYGRDPTNQQDLGKALVYALTTIIGFYFGTATAPKATPQSATPPAITTPAQPK
jgi:hypothetical protein